MTQTIIVGIWACFATIAGAYGGSYWRTHANDGKVAHEERLEPHKIKPISVPIIADGILKGYISAEFSLLTPKTSGHGQELDPEGYFVDEAFRLIYSNNELDFTKMQKSDLAALTSQITANVNKRIGKEVVRETLVKNFAFIPREELPH